MRPFQLLWYVIVLTTVCTASLPTTLFLNNQSGIPDGLSNGGNASPKLADIVDPQTSYSPDDSIRINGTVDLGYYWAVIRNESSAEGTAWFVPQQEVAVYIKANPCETFTDTYGCEPSVSQSEIENFKLELSAGSTNLTGGVDTVAPFGQDDNYGIINDVDENTTYTEEAREALKYDFSVEIPDRSEWDALGLQGGEVEIFEFYPGNSTLGTKPFVLSNYTITVASEAELIQLNQTSTSFHPGETLEMAWKTQLAGGDPVPLTTMQYIITYEDAPATTCASNGTGCSTIGLQVTSDPYETNNDGEILYSIEVVRDPTYGIAKEGRYNFTVVAEFATDPFNETTDKTDTPWNLRNNLVNSTLFNVTYKSVSFTNTQVNSTELTPNTPSTQMTFHAEVFNGGTINVDDATINFGITHAEDNVSCGSVYGLDCSSSALGFTVTPSDPNELTNVDGDITFTTIFDFGVTPEGTYQFMAYANFTNPDLDNGGWDTRDNPYYITEDLNVTVQFTIDYGLKNGTLSTQPVKGFTQYPLDPGNPIMRPGDNFEALVEATVEGQADVLANAGLIYQLYNSTHNLTDTLASNLIPWLEIIEVGGSETNSTGLLQFILNTTYDAIPDDYELRIYGNFSAITNQSPYWIGWTQSPSYVSYSWTIDPLYDIGALMYVHTLPDTTSRPTTSGSVMQVVFRAEATTNTTYRTYANNYSPTNIPTTYELVGLPVNATIDWVTDVLPGVSLDVASGFAGNGTFWETNSTGHIVFDITSIYPDAFIEKSLSLNVYADFKPMIEADVEAYRFTRVNAAGTNITSPTNSNQLTIDPEYTVIGLRYVQNNITGNTQTYGIRPGEDAVMKFQAYDTGLNTGVADVTFQYYLRTGTSTAGLVLSTNATTLNVGPGDDWYLTDANGYIYIFVDTTYGVTNETASAITISIEVYLNVSLFNETQADANYYIGSSHQGTDNASVYHITWSNQSRSFSIRASYIVGEGVMSTISSAALLSSNRVRPGNTIQVALQVRNTANNNPLALSFPVNFTLAEAYNGVTIVVADPTIYHQVRTGWYNTTADGRIVLNVTFTYDPVTAALPKTQTIKINATVDFQNKTSDSYTTEAMRWIVGETTVTGYNRSQRSFTTVPDNERLTINENPLYIQGVVGFNTANGTSGQLKVLPGDSISFSYRVTISGSDTNAALDGVQTDPVSGVTVRVNTTRVTELGFVMTSPTTQVTDTNGLVTFQVLIPTDAVDALYSIDVLADFENDTSATVEGVNSSGTLRHWWINGTILSNDPSYPNATYSVGSNFVFEVKRVRQTVTTIENVYDLDGQVVSPAKTVRYGEEVELKILYRFDNGTGIPGQALTVVFQVQNPSGAWVDVNFTDAVTTDGSGQVTQNFTITDARFLVGEVGVFAFDDYATAEQQPSTDNFTIWTNLTFSNINMAGPASSSQIFSGENITITGTVQDDQNRFGTNYYTSAVLAELDDMLKVYGTDTSDTPIAGNVDVFESLTFGTSGATFTAVWTVPLSYSNSEVRIHVEIVQDPSIEHFNPLPLTFTQDVQTYQNVSYHFKVATNSTYFNQNGLEIIVNDTTAALSVEGWLEDNYGRTLTGRSTNVSLHNITDDTLYDTAVQTTINIGNFSFADLGAISYENISYTLRIRHILPNGTAITAWELTVVRLVYDVTAPIINIIDPVDPSNWIYYDLTLNYTVYDASVSVSTVGLDVNSLILLMNGTEIWNNVGGANWDGTGILAILWDFSTVDMSYNTVNLTLVAYDNAGNMQMSTITFRVDWVKPTIEWTDPDTSEVVYQQNYMVSFNTTDAQSEINLTSAYVEVDYSNTTIDNIPMTYNETSGEFWTTLNFQFIRADVKLSFGVRDMAGNLQTSNVTLVADITAPTVSTMLSPVNGVGGEIYITGSVSVSFYTQDAQSGINENNITIFRDGTDITAVVSGSMTVSYDSSSGWLVDFIVTVDTPIATDIIFSIVFSDNNGNTQTVDPLFTVKADTTAPDIQIHADNTTDSSTIRMGQIQIRFAVDDNDQAGIDWTNYIITRNGVDVTSQLTDASTDQTDAQTGSFTIYDTITPRVDANIIYVLTVYDAYGNSGNSPQFIVLPDLTAPQTNVLNTEASADNNTYHIEPITLVYDVADGQDESGINGSLTEVLVDNTVSTIPSTYNESTGQVTVTINLGSGQTADASYVLRVYDSNQNAMESDPFIVRADVTNPQLSLSSPTNETELYPSRVNLQFTVWDEETNLAFASTDVLDVEVQNEVGTTIRTLDVTSSGVTVSSNLTEGRLVYSYLFTTTINRTELNLTKSVQTLYVVATDQNGNEMTYVVQFSIDIAAPVLTDSGVANETDRVDTTKDNVLLGLHTIFFNLTDQGSPASGVNTSALQLVLEVNGHTYDFATLKANSNFTTPSSLGSNIVVVFNVTEENLQDLLRPYENLTIERGKTTYVEVSWVLSGIIDREGNALPSQTISYIIELVGPPPRDIIAEVAFSGASFGVFLGVGVLLAFIFEKIRYE